jgi:O-antigen ligase
VSSVTFSFMVFTINAVAWLTVGGIPIYSIWLAGLILLCIGKLNIKWMATQKGFFSTILAYGVLSVYQIIASISFQIETENIFSSVANIVAAAALVFVSMLVLDSHKQVERMISVVLIVQIVSLLLGVSQVLFKIGYFLPTQYQSTESTQSPAGLSSMTFSFASYFFPLTALWLSDYCIRNSSGGKGKLSAFGSFNRVIRLCGFVGVCGILISNSRSGQVALVLSFVIGYMAINGMGKTFQKFLNPKSSLLFVSVLGPIIIVFYLLKPVSSDGDLDYNNYARLELWKASVTAFADSPIVGHGSSSVKTVIEKYLAEPGKVVERMPHNIFLHLLVETGIIGFILFLYPFASIITRLVIGIHKSANQNPDVQRLRLFVVLYLFMFFVDSFFHNTLNTNMIWIILALGMRLSNISTRNRKIDAFV